MLQRDVWSRLRPEGFEEYILGLVFRYAVRLNPATRRLVMSRSPAVHFLDSSRTLGLPIRGSDKCGRHARVTVGGNRSMEGARCRLNPAARRAGSGGTMLRVVVVVNMNQNECEPSAELAIVRGGRTPSATGGAPTGVYRRA